jgi:hypothetical protein
MDTIIINLTNGSVKTYTDIYNTIISGNHLIITTKTTVKSEGNHFVLTANDVFDLKNIINYTTKIKTIKYGEE